MSLLVQFQNELQAFSSPDRAVVASRFFKTGKGQYGEGDLFLGISMPEIRTTVAKYQTLSIFDWKELLHSPYHEFRMAALIGLTKLFKKAKKEEQTQQIIFDIYLTNFDYINNWDLVDVTCRDIVGAFLLHRDRGILYELAQSTNLWAQRVAIVSTWLFIKHHQFLHTLQISKMLLTHKHDLIYKAVGWMLREIGKRDVLVLEEFLDTHIHQMPRTALRCAIERFPESKRKYYLSL